MADAGGVHTIILHHSNTLLVGSLRDKMPASTAQQVHEWPAETKVSPGHGLEWGVFQHVWVNASWATAPVFRD